jgi:hypothetical protein
MQLGIIVVYLFDTNTEYLLDFHIGSIRKFTLSPYTIYGSVARLDPRWRQKLSKYPEIQQCEIPLTELRGGDEHAFYLDRLTEIAFQKGATHVVSLHLDSFPVCKGWERTLEAIANRSGTCIAAEKTYTACLFFSKDFYFRYRPTFCSADKLSAYLEFVKKYKLVNHSGTPYLYTCYANHLDYHILKEMPRDRISRFGILCGGLIFHFEEAIRFSPGRGLREERSPGKVRSIMPLSIQFLRKIPLLRATWLWICKNLPKTISSFLKRWLANQVAVGEIAETEFFKLRLIEKSKSGFFEVENSIWELQDAIQHIYCARSVGSKNLSK